MKGKRPIVLMEMKPGRRRRDGTVRQPFSLPSRVGGTLRGQP